jgi:hypothetical protein
MNIGPTQSKQYQVRKLEMILRRVDFITISEMIKLMNCSEKTFYNYMDELKIKYKSVIEFQRKPRGAYRIYDPINSSNQGLTDEEFNILIDRLELNPADENLKAKVLGIISNSRWINYHFYEKIKLIKRCIEKQNMIHVRVYYPRGKDPLRGIDLEPVYFDESNGRLRAIRLEDKSQIPKLYNLENMEGLQISHHKFKKMPFNIDPVEIVDPFGFSKNRFKDEYDLTILLKPFAYSQLFRQFPKMVKFITKLDESESPYLYVLKITVFDVEPIARFLTGLLNEVKIKGTEHSRMKIKEYIKNRVFEGYDDNFNQLIFEK